MARATASIVIDRPPEQVFAFMADPATMAQWTNMESMQYDGPVAPGVTGRAVWKLLGRRRTVEIVTTAYEPNRRWAMRIPGRLGILLDYNFHPADGRTRVEQVVGVEPTGFMRLFAPLLARLVRSEEAAELKRLKKAVEASPPTPRSAG